MSIRLTLPDQKLKQKFLSLQTRQDIADLLEISDYQLRYHLYISNPHQRYNDFQIPKRSGGTRQIKAPISPLKIIQRKLNQVLQAVYQTKNCNHGFVKNKNVLTNAKEHLRKRFVLNIDLENFFPSINFGRVRGMFMSRPYNLNPQVATILAQICCYENQLPQGAPTSPVISNMICAKLDDNLLKLARQHRCIYTRYADDITFSTYQSKFPEGLAKYNSSGQLEIGSDLANVIAQNGFTPNSNKIFLQTPARRQRVTGITVNKIANVNRKYLNQIRAMLHAWEKYGLKAAEDEFRKKYDQNGKYSAIRKASFPYIVKGKIEFLGMVRGKDSSVYLKYYNQLCRLAPQFAPKQPVAQPAIRLVKPCIITEGETDWKHLEISLKKLQKQGLFVNMELDFHKSLKQAGGASVKNICIQFANKHQDQITIFIFDNDDQTIIKDVSSSGENYKNWSNNVFSFVIPVPAHRSETPEVCIEMYYKDIEITREDEKGRRLFLSNEFQQRSGRHKMENNLNCTNLQKIKDSKKLCVIDDRVFDSNENNVALPKNDFAEYVLKQAVNFDNFDHTEFGKIFDIIHAIITENTY